MCIFHNTGVSGYCDSAAVSASWKMSNCPSTPAGALHTPCTHPDVWSNCLCSWWRAPEVGHAPSHSISASGSISRNWLTLLQGTICRQTLQVSGRWQPSHIARMGRQLQYFGTLWQWTQTRSHGEDNTQGRIHTLAMSKKEMTKRTAAHAFLFWEVMLAEDTRCRKLSIGI